MDTTPSCPSSRFNSMPRAALAACLLAAALAACGGGSSGGSTTNGSTGSTSGGSTSFLQSATPTTGTALAEVLTRTATATATARTPNATELLDWAQSTFPSLFPSASASANQTQGSYTYRTYSSTDFALAIHTDGTVLGFVGISTASPRSVSLGTLSQFACSVFPASCTTTVTLAQKAGALAIAIGKPKRLLIGLGAATLDSVQAQGLKPDIHARYLNRADRSANSWPKWNQPDGAYVGVVAAEADAMGAVPMFTLYQMATWGEGNFAAALLDQALMKGYWDNVRLMYQQIKLYGKPTLVNLEPDFWGYTQRIHSDPTQHVMHVANVNADCSTLPNTVAGMGECLVQMARSIAPNARVGFPPSGFDDLAATELAYMQKVGAGKADFVVMQTLDRDAGCFEAGYVACNRPSTESYYWNDAAFANHFALARRLHEGYALPLLWWQTPMGVPSDTPGGKPGAFRDNRMQYFLTRPSELVAAGGVGVVFSGGEDAQTSIDTDGGQFRRLSASYLASPVALP